MLPISEPSQNCRRALARCRAAAAEWSRRSIEHRLQIIRRARQTMAREARSLAATVQRRPIHDTLVCEVLPLLEGMRFLERRAKRILATQTLRTGRPLWLLGVSAKIYRAPRGVVLILAPGNYPLFLPGIHAIQALVAGNGVCLKPAPGGEAAARAVADRLIDAGLGSDLLQVLDSRDGAAAVACDFDHIVLTGSAQTGIKVLEATIERLIPCTMELSGCDAAFVLPGADLIRVARCLTYGLTLNDGATCIAPRRVFVLKAHAAALEQLLIPRLQAIQRISIPPSIAPQLDALLLEAQQSGGRVIRPQPNGAVIVADARVDMNIFKHNLFAPWLAILPVNTMEEALAASARCSYALGASVFGPRSEAEDLASRVAAGSICINDVIVPTSDPRLPFGGSGRSGFGRTRGAEGLLEMTISKAVSVRRRSFMPHLTAPHASDEVRFTQLIQLLHGTWHGRLSRRHSRGGKET